MSMRRQVGAGARPLALAGLLVMTACGGQLLPSVGTSSPAWLDRPPASQDELCAVGVSGPTFYHEDALANSTAQAFTALARGVQVKIASELAMQQRGNGRGRSAVTVEELSTFMTRVMLQLAHIKGHWVTPEESPARGAPGTAYTLVCMPLTVTAAELGDVMQRYTTPATDPRLPVLLKHTETIMKKWAQ